MYLTVCILMDFSLHIETICVGLFILYFKGGHRETFLNSDVFVPEGYFILNKQIRPWLNAALCCISSWSLLLTKVFI